MRSRLTQYPRPILVALGLGVVSACSEAPPSATAPSLDAPVPAASPASPAAVDKSPGPRLGDKAPAFALKDQADKERKLGDFLGKGKVALVFYRSADW